MLCGINSPFELVSPARGHVIYALLTRLPLCIAAPFDLHVLGTPPALVLSQDQTLQQMVSCSFRHTTLFARSLLIHNYFAIHELLRAQLELISSNSLSIIQLSKTRPASAVRSSPSGGRCAG